MKIIITETQEKTLYNMFLKEAMMDSFSYEELNSLPSFAKKVAYCKQHLGRHIGNGSSRLVFQIDDGKVLKLAKNKKGLAQNEYEYDNYYTCDDDVLPHCYECADDYSWIISEYVLPAKVQDFKVVFGMSWRDFCSWLYATYRQYANSYERKNCAWLAMDYDKWLDSLENNDEIQPLYNWLTNHQYNQIGDLARKANWGLTIRNNEPCLVILDNGLSEEIYNEYYKKH